MEQKIKLQDLPLTEEEQKIFCELMSAFLFNLRATKNTLKKSLNVSLFLLSQMAAHKRLFSKIDNLESVYSQEGITEYLDKILTLTEKNLDVLTKLKSKVGSDQ